MSQFFQTNNDVDSNEAKQYRQNFLAKMQQKLADKELAADGR